MESAEDDFQDADIPQQALQALAHAQQNSMKAGHPQVLVRDGYLVRISGETVQILKKMPDRIPVVHYQQQSSR